ncbi:hypothetical protein GQ600_9327 [Phytophthora cactorum]|nr:hypothetical protein GQ600_9327 [Phytophthora cactorum]
MKLLHSVDSYHFLLKGTALHAPDQALHQKLIPDTFDDLPDSDDECAILKTDLSLEYKTRVVFRYKLRISEVEFQCHSMAIDVLQRIT